MKTICRKIRASVMGTLCILAVLFTAMPPDSGYAKTAGVSSGEQKKIQRLIDSSIIHYIEGACNYPPKLEHFQFNKKMMTEIAFHNVKDDDAVSSQYSSDAALMEKYRPYGGVFRYTDTVKSAVRKKGKALFGDSFRISFAAGDGFSVFSNYPVSHDKKYILMNFSDWGDWYAEHRYKIQKKDHIYTVNIRVSSYWGGAEDDVTVHQFHVDLKKKNGSFQITDIVFDR